MEGQEMTVMGRREYLRIIYDRYRRCSPEKKGAIHCDLVGTGTLADPHRPNVVAGALYACMMAH